MLLFKFFYQIRAVSAWFKKEGFLSFSRNETTVGTFAAPILFHSMNESELQPKPHPVGIEPRLHACRTEMSPSKNNETLARSGNTSPSHSLDAKQ